MTEVTRGHTASASEMDPTTIRLITTFIFYFGPYLMMDIVEWRCHGFTMQSHKIWNQKGRKDYQNRTKLITGFI